MNALSVAVIAGGPSTEANVSRTSARAVMQALAARGHRAELLELDADLASKLQPRRHDVVFPVTHGPLGEDGCLQGLLEVLDLPYVGSGVLASALAASKPHAKLAFRAAGLPLAADELVARGAATSTRVGALLERFGAGMVVKPASGGSAIATTRIAAGAAADEVKAALAAAHAVDAVALVEAFVTGDEVTCGVLDRDDGPRALPPTRIASKAADWYDFASRYAAGGSAHECPAALPDAVTARIQGVAVAAHRALGARDLSRVDFVVGAAQDGSGVVLLEVNTLPGMTATSLFPEAAAVAGIDFPSLCDGLARRAMSRPRREVPEALPMP